MERAGSDLTAFGETVVFLDYFKDLPDPRQAGKVIYPLPEVLLLCLLAVLGGGAVWGKEDRAVAPVSAVLPWDARP